MRGSGKVSRAIHPRSARVVVNTTEGVRARLEQIARARGWSLSKTGNAILVLGLEAWDQVIVELAQERGREGGTGEVEMSEDAEGLARVLGSFASGQGLTVD